MPIEDVDIACPVCGRCLTDVDGLLECQNDPQMRHFVYCPGFCKPFFNFKEWAERKHPIINEEKIADILMEHGVSFENKKVVAKIVELLKGK